MDHDVLGMVLQRLPEADPMLVVALFVSKRFYHTYRWVKVKTTTKTSHVWQHGRIVESKVPRTTTKLVNYRISNEDGEKFTDYTVIHGYNKLFYWAVRNGAFYNGHTASLIIEYRRPVRMLQYLGYRWCRNKILAGYHGLEWCLNFVDPYHINKIAKYAVIEEHTANLAVLIRYEQVTFDEVCQKAITEKRKSVFVWTIRRYKSISADNLLYVAGHIEDPLDWLETAWLASARIHRTHFNDLVDYAAKTGKLGLLQWAVQKKLPWTEKTMRLALLSASTDVIRCCVLNGCPWDPTTTVLYGTHRLVDICDSLHVAVDESNKCIKQYRKRHHQAPPRTYGRKKQRGCNSDASVKTTKKLA